MDQLLSLARLQNEKLPRENINLSRILSEVLSNIVPSASQKKIEISKEIAGNICVYGHSASVEILLSNLLDNAVKYTPEEGKISVRLEQDGTLRISDSGPGLSDLDKKRVFERFVRADKSGQSGSGLGLSIVQWVAGAHDVQIRLLDKIPSGLIVEIRWSVLPCR